MKHLKEINFDENDFNDKDLKARFFKNVYYCGVNDCWLWMAGKIKITKGSRKGQMGYGIFYFKDRMVYSHRLSFLLSRGYIPKGNVIMHTCDNPNCVNPAHLVAGTQKDNSQDMLKKGRENPMRGENHYNSKLTEKQVAKIRELHETGQYTQTYLAKFYSVSQSLICHIIHNQNWTHIS